MRDAHMKRTHGGPGVSLRIPYVLCNATRFALMIPLPSNAHQNKALFCSRNKRFWISLLIYCLCKHTTLFDQAI